MGTCLFDYVTDYSDFLLKKQFPNGFFDFKDKLLVTVKLTIKINPKTEFKERLEISIVEEGFSDNKIDEKFIVFLNETKTIDVRFSTIVAQYKDSSVCESLILMESKVASFRQNADDLFNSYFC